jgi:hypothetical protein
MPDPLEPPRLGTTLPADRVSWRPFDDRGDLLPGTGAASAPEALIDDCGNAVRSHLLAVCLWPDETRGLYWNTGDYSFYILSFTNAQGANVFVQFWSEPGENVLFEVSSGEVTPPARRSLTDHQREGLRDHGFEIGDSRNFTKSVSVTVPVEVAALAREALAVLSRVLGYDGSVPLSYQLHLGSRTLVRRVFTHMSPNTLEQLLGEWQFPAPLCLPGGEPVMQCWIDHHPFRIALHGREGLPPGEFGMISLRASFESQGGDVLEIANTVNRQFALMQAYVAADGVLVAESQILLRGGIAEEHVRSRFQFWQTTIRQLVSRFSAPRAGQERFST